MINFKMPLKHANILTLEIALQNKERLLVQHFEDYFFDGRFSFGWNNIIMFTSENNVLVGPSQFKLSY